MEILEKCVLSANCPNLIIYGRDKEVEGSLLNLLSQLNDSPFRELCENNVTWRSNQLCKIFNMRLISTKTSDIFFNILHQIVVSKNYYSEINYRIVILQHYDKVSHHIQSKLRVIIEKYRLTTIFIMTTDKLTSIIEPIKSRCLCIRIPNLNMTEKRHLSRGIIRDLSYEKKSIIYDKIYLTKNNTELHFYSEYNEGLFLGYQTIYELIYNNLIQIMEKDRITEKDIIHVRELSYQIEKYNLYEIHKELLSLCISDPKFTFTKKSQLIQLFSDSEYEYQKSYRSVIHIENLLIRLLYLPDWTK